MTIKEMELLNPIIYDRVFFTPTVYKLSDLITMPWHLKISVCVTFSMLPATHLVACFPAALVFVEIMEWPIPFAAAKVPFPPLTKEKRKSD